MATSYKTPGVYVEEIPKLPPSVAQVETAIPAFIGYTEKAEKNGENIAKIPTRLSSFVEFESYFGSAYTYAPGDLTVQLNENNNYAVQKVSFTGKSFYLYDAMRLFFDNGGGDCYVVSVSFFKDATFTSSGDLSNSNALTAGLTALEKYDEPTIIVIPDAVNLPDTQFYGLLQAVLMQCGKLQDRVGVFDLQENKNNWDDAVSNFRDNIGINNLKYGAAYTPWLYTAYPKDIAFTQFSGSLKDSTNTTISNLATLTTDTDVNNLVKAMQAAVTASTTAVVNVDAIRDADTTNGTIPATGSAPFTAPTIRDAYKVFTDALRNASGDANVKAAYNNLIAFIRNAALKLQSWKTDFTSDNITSDVNAYAASPNLWRGGVTDLIKIEKNKDGRSISEVANANDVNASYGAVDTTWLGGAASTIINDVNGDGTEDDGKDYDDSGAITDKKELALLIEKDLKTAFEKIATFVDTVLSSVSTYQQFAQDALYEKHPIISNVVRSLTKEISQLPPSSAIAGIYARVDNARGVWKAPANESINSVTGPTEQITADDQAALNVDPTAGKSVNAIRAFTGKGTLVWGARTLAGNDNEWRYVSIRRFFNMVEESSKKSSELFVFEPNDANTWVKVQGMLENFLTVLWRQGALQGAKPEQAFYVAVGLGKTMTALDILEGRMIIEIGLAVVRPAEFIILRFSHKMVES